MGVYYDEINVKTKGEVDIINITDDIQNIVSKSKLKEGIVCIFVKGSTGTITTIEYEPGLMKDFPKALEKIAPKGEYYANIIIIMKHGMMIMAIHMFEQV